MKRFIVTCASLFLCTVAGANNCKMSLYNTVDHEANCDFSAQAFFQQTAGSQCWYELDVTDNAIGSGCRMVIEGWCDNANVCTANGKQRGTDATSPGSVALALFCSCASYSGKIAEMRFFYEAKPYSTCGCAHATCADFAYAKLGSCAVDD